MSIPIITGPRKHYLAVISFVKDYMMCTVVHTVAVLRMLPLLPLHYPGKARKQGFGMVKVPSRLGMLRAAWGLMVKSAFLSSQSCGVYNNIFEVFGGLFFVHLLSHAMSRMG